MRDAPPGPWLRLCGIAASVTAATAVASGSLGIAHRLLTVIAVPLLAALVVAARLSHPPLLLPSAAALVAFLAAAATWWSGAAHVALAAAALALTLVATVQVFRAERVDGGAWRDYLTLTKPRIMSLLLITGAGGMFVGAGGVPPLRDLAAWFVQLWAESLGKHRAQALLQISHRDRLPVDRHLP